ncbi:MAG TPA: insulinase family protein, partial [Planctomycetota bacterium]
MFRALAFIAVLALSMPAAAQDPPAGAGVRIPVDELVLDNGMKVLTVERPGVPRVFCALYWKVGSVNERPGITGLSHFFEHMMFKGTDVIGTSDPKRDRELNALIEGVMGKIRELKLLGLEALRQGTPISETARKGGATIRAEDEEKWKALKAEYDALIEDQKKISLGEHLSKLFQA